VLDAYFDGLFHAWPSGRASAPRSIVGFIPKMALKRENIAHFFGDYPDGRLVTIMRNPADWFVSLCAHTKGGVERYGDLEQETALWNRMAMMALNYREAHGDKVLLLSFNELISDRARTMRRLAAWCGIDFDEALTQQTFAGQPIAPNTNFDASVEGLSEKVLERGSQLSDSERHRIATLTGDTVGRLREAGCWLAAP
jgi:hypothetical protein